MNLEQIKKQITEPSKRATINDAIYHQNRLKFHAQTRIKDNCISQPITDFLNHVKGLIPEDKYKTFLSLFRYPVKTNEVTGICFDKLSRIFDGRNPAFNYQFMNAEQRDDWEYYRQDVLREPDVWSSKGWEYFQTEINSVLVVDMPSEQAPGEKYPCPYFYWLPIGAVIDYSVDNSTGIMEWIIFLQKDNNIAVIDNERYRIFSKTKEQNIGIEIVNNPHDLGYCPARFFWNQSLNLFEPDVKLSPLTKQLDSLDKFLFRYISKQHLDLYASYPIYSGYEMDCNFENKAKEQYCDGGFLRNAKGDYLLDSAGLLHKCPKCGERRIAGAGSFVQIPIPDGNKVQDLRNPVQILTIDRQSLDYNVSEEERTKNNIITAIVGTNEETTTKEAINEDQVKANFESQSTILNRIKKGFEAAQQFVDETICKLRYGKMFVSAKINYGTEFYLSSTNELRERYKIAKESGASESELDALQNQIIETEYRNNPTQLQRMIILSELEPYRHLSRDEALNLYDKGIISQSDIKLKLNFVNFVSRFEREYLNILEFGYNMPYNSKINFITDKLTEYANNMAVTPTNNN